MLRFTTVKSTAGTMACWLLALVISAMPMTAAANVRGIALPSQQGTDTLQELADQVASALAARLGLAPLNDEPLARLETLLRSARELSAAGDLDAASRALETAISEALHKIHLLPPGAPILEAHVELAAIAVASGQSSRAKSLLDRILHLDPGYTLRPKYRSPRMAGAFAEAKQRAAGATALEVGVLGSSCGGGATVVVVVRRLADGALEFARYDDCRLHAKTRTSGSPVPADLAAALDPGLSGHRPRPFYKKTWFWAGTTAAMVGGAALYYFAIRDSGRQTTITPIP